MKKHRKLDGVEVLTKPQQKKISGGLTCRHIDAWCPCGTYCCGGPDVGLCTPEDRDYFFNSDTDF